MKKVIFNPVKLLPEKTWEKALAGFSDFFPKYKIKFYERDSNLNPIWERLDIPYEIEEMLYDQGDSEVFRPEWQDKCQSIWSEYLEETLVELQLFCKLMLLYGSTMAEAKEFLKLNLPEDVNELPKGESHFYLSFNIEKRVYIKVPATNANLLGPWCIFQKNDLYEFELLAITPKQVQKIVDYLSRYLFAFGMKAEVSKESANMVDLDSVDESRGALFRALKLFSVK